MIEKIPLIIRWIARALPFLILLLLLQGCAAGIRLEGEEAGAVSTPTAGAGIPGSPASTSSLRTAVIASACSTEINTARFRGFVCTTTNSIPGVIEGTSHAVSDPFLELGIDSILEESP